MPDIWLDVDAALASVPVNKMPLIDDTDFKTIEAAVVYNQAGLALFWNFTTTAGTTTVTAVTPTTAGVYDWTDFTTSGMYGIEIPASGGASANNDTEGVGHFTGVATGILPWTGPTIGFRDAAINNLLIDDAYSTTRGLAGTALPAAAADAAGGLVISDAGGLGMDAVLSGNTPQTGDTYALANGTAGFVAIDTVVDAILVDTGTTIPATITTAQNDLDIITGVSGVNLLTATQASIDAIEVDTGTTLDGKINTIDTNVDSILVDTGTTIPAQITTAQNDLDIITGASGVNLLTATQASIDAIEVDTGTTLDTKINTIDTNVDAVLVDTGTTIPALIGTPAADISADIAAVKVDTAATLVDTAQIGVAGAGLTDLGGMSTAMKAEVNTEADTALTDYDPPTNAEMETRTPTAAQLAYITAHAATALPVTFTGGTTTTAILGNVDGSAASTTNDVYNGAVLVFNAGTLNEQRTDITDYVGATKTATITAVTTAVTSSHTAILV